MKRDDVTHRAKSLSVFNVVSSPAFL